MPLITDNHSSSANQCCSIHILCEIVFLHLARETQTAVAALHFSSFDGPFGTFTSTVLQMQSVLGFSNRAAIYAFINGARYGTSRTSLVPVSISFFCFIFCIHLQTSISKCRPVVVFRSFTYSSSKFLPDSQWNLHLHPDLRNQQSELRFLFVVLIAAEFQTKQPNHLLWNLDKTRSNRLCVNPKILRHDTTVCQCDVPAIGDDQKTDSSAERQENFQRCRGFAILNETKQYGSANASITPFCQGHKFHPLLRQDFWLSPILRHNPRKQ